MVEQWTLNPLAVGSNPTRLTQFMNLNKIAVISYHTCPLSDEDVTQTGGLNIYVLEPDFRKN